MDKTPPIVSPPPPFVLQLSLAQAVLLKKHCSEPLSTVSTRRNMRRSITFTPKNRNRIWLAELPSVPKCHRPLNVREVERIFSECAVRCMLHRFEQCNLFFILNNPSILMFPTRNNGLTDPHCPSAQQKPNS